MLERLEKNYERAMQEEPILDRDGNSTGEYKYQGMVANKALELIGRHLAMFTDKHQDVTPEGAEVVNKTA